MSYRRQEGLQYYEELGEILQTIGVDLDNIVKEKDVVALQIGGGTDLYALAPPICGRLFANEPEGFRHNPQPLSDQYQFDLMQARSDNTHVVVDPRDNVDFLTALKESGIRPTLITNLRVHPVDAGYDQLVATTKDSVGILCQGGVFALSVDYSLWEDDYNPPLAEVYTEARSQPNLTASIVIPELDLGKRMLSGGLFLIVRKD
jgi:hypothetical protein